MFRSDLEQEVVETTDALAGVVRGLDPDEVPAFEAVRIYRALDRAVRTLSAAKTVLARRVEDSWEW